MSNLSGNDLVYYKENNRIMSGGFNINSILMNQNISPVLSMNKSEQVGGNVSNLFKSLAVPTGLLYLHEKKDKHKSFEFYNQFGGKKKTVKSEGKDTKDTKEKGEKGEEEVEEDEVEEEVEDEDSSSDSDSSSSSNSDSSSSSESDSSLNNDEVLTEEVFKKCFDLVSNKISQINSRNKKRVSRKKDKKCNNDKKKKSRKNKLQKSELEE